MGSIKRWFCRSYKYLLGTAFFTLIQFIVNILNVGQKYTILFYVSVICLPFLVLRLLYICFKRGPKLFFRRRKFILKNSISKADDILTNVASMIPSTDEVVLLEKKASVYHKAIKGALSSRFNCSIRFMACGSVPERFGVPLVNDWISDVGQMEDAHALLSDQDFLVEPRGITASYSAQFDKVEIVQRKSCIEKGFAMLDISKPLSRKFNLKEGYLSTAAIKHSVFQCIAKVPATNFPGIFRRDQATWLDRQSISHQVKIDGPAINLHIKTLNHDSIFLADFTFAIRCFTWPPESDWPLRNKMWPDHRVVAIIKDLGFHFVPRNQKNDKSNLTWRYSFSLAEKELSKQVNEIARKCFLCFKIISVDHLKPICKRLKSYHLKTILFRSLEATSAEMWSQKNILSCLDYLLKKFEKAFHEQKCMHFWISRINLFQDFNHHRLSKLEVKVKEIRKNIFRFLVTYSIKFRPCCLSLEQKLFCFCFGIERDDENMIKNQIKNSRIRKSISVEAAAEEGNRVQVSPEEEAVLITDSCAGHFYGSFSREENQRTEKKYLKVIDDDISNRKIEFKVNIEIVKMKSNYKKVGKKIWRDLKCKEIVALRDFLYKV